MGSCVAPQCSENRCLRPVDGLDPPSWTPRRSRSSELEEGPGHGPRSEVFVPFTWSRARSDVPVPYTLTRIPGVGPFIDAKILGEVGDPSSLERPHHQHRNVVRPLAVKVAGQGKPHGAVESPGGPVSILRTVFVAVG
jgi:hypothetical protein